jgi:hypothetical protein
MKKKIRLKSEFVGAQWEFMNDLKTKFLHLSAGYGFGKTRTLCYKLLDLSIRNAPHPGGLVVPSYSDFTRDVKVALEDIFHENKIDAKFHGAEHSYKLPWTKGKLYVATAEKKIRGPNWAYAGINEVTLISLERYREVVGRVRIKGADFPQIVSSGTPEGIASEYYAIFAENPWANSRILYGDTRENAHNLEPTYIQSLLDSYPKQLIDAYLKGLWVNLTGNRFYYSYDSKNNEQENKPDENLPFLIAMDFNVDPLTCSIWQQWGNKFIGIDEIVLEGGEGFKTENMVKALAARGYDKRNSVICPDPAGKNRNTSGKTDVEILRDNYGFTVHVKAAAPRFRERQINMNNLFEKGRIIVNPVTQKWTKKDFIAVECDPITLEKVKKNPKLTHLSDGVDYMIDIYSPFNDHRSRNDVYKLR